MTPSRRFLTTAALLLLLLPCRAAAQALPPDLALVPADAQGFVHVRLADIWKSEPFKEWRTTILKAGDQALAAFDKRFVPAPSSIERLTAILMPPGPGEREPDVLVVLATSKPIDRDAFLRQTVPGAQEERVAGKSYYLDVKTKTAMFFVGERALAFGSPSAVQSALSKPAVRQGPLSEALALANSGKPLVVGVNAAALPPQVLQAVPFPLQPLVQAKLATLTVEFGDPGKLDLRLTYASPEDAEAAEQSARLGLQLARAFLAKTKAEMTAKVQGGGRPGSLEELPEAAGALFALGVINRVDEFLAAPPLKREGTGLRVALEFPQIGSQGLSLAAVSIGLLVPAVQKVREAAARTQDQNNLKQIGVALHNFHDVHKGLPAAAICDPAGKPLLSWRVAILPYIEQDNLYRQFKLDEPWDSEHNRKLIPLMPPTYANPAAPLKPGETHYRVLVGNGALFDTAKPTKFAQIMDGTSNTIMVVETADAVPWTKPDEVRYDPEKPLPKFFPFHSGGGYNVLLADGSVRYFSSAVAERTLRALITRSGGEVIDDTP